MRKNKLMGVVSDDPLECSDTEQQDFSNSASSCFSSDNPADHGGGQQQQLKSSDTLGGTVLGSKSNNNDYDKNDSDKSNKNINKGVVVVLSTEKTVKRAVRMKQQAALDILNYKLLDVPYDILDAADPAYDSRRAQLLRLCHSTAGSSAATTDYPLFFLVTHGNTVHEEILYKGNFEWFETALEGGFLQDMLLSESYRDDGSLVGGRKHANASWEDPQNTMTTKQEVHPTHRSQSTAGVSAASPSNGPKLQMQSRTGVFVATPSSGLKPQGQSMPGVSVTSPSSSPRPPIQSMTGVSAATLSSGPKPQKQSMKGVSVTSPSSGSKLRRQSMTGMSMATPSRGSKPRRQSMTGASVVTPSRRGRRHSMAAGGTVNEENKDKMVNMQTMEFGNGVVMVMETAFAIKPSVRRNQQKALNILHRMQLPFRILDASNLDHEEQRLRLLNTTKAAAGETADYPHFFWVEQARTSEEEIEYKGNFEWLETAYEAGCLKSMLFHVDD